MKVGYFCLILSVYLYSMVITAYGESTSTSPTPSIQLPCGFLDSLFSYENGVWGDGCTTCTCVLGYAKCDSVNDCEPSSNGEDTAKINSGRRRRRRSDLEMVKFFE